MLIKFEAMEILLKTMVVKKTLRSLHENFDIVATIEESKYFCTFSFHELIGSLEAQEERLMSRSLTNFWSMLFNSRFVGPKAHHSSFDDD